MKVAELEGAKLDYWVARAEKIEGAHMGVHGCVLVPENDYWSVVYSPATNWARGGPIIERESIQLAPRAGKTESMWCAWLPFASTGEPWEVAGGTALEAAMRAYVASKFGDEVPDEVAA